MGRKTSFILSPGQFDQDTILILSMDRIRQSLGK